MFVHAFFLPTVIFLQSIVSDHVSAIQFHLVNSDSSGGGGGGGRVSVLVDCPT